MDAMIFAAGLGTRLRPLTDVTPKPLIAVGGVPMLERVLRRVIACGADRVVINTSHLGDQIETFIADHAGFGVDVRLSNEPDTPLETGGALRHARAHFRHAGPVLLHNADVLSDVPLDALLAAHDRAARGSGALATLAVLEHATERYLIFDADGLVGFAARDSGEERLVRPARGELRRHDFTGIHVIAPRLFEELPESGAFSIMSVYLRLAAAGERIMPFVAAGSCWIDIGSHDALARAERRLARGTPGPAQ